MTQPSYPVSTIAKLFNLTERRVQQLAKDGVIPKANKGKYELVACVQGYIHYLQERAMGKDSAPQDTYTERARLLKAQADKTELEVGTLKGNLLQIGSTPYATVRPSSHVNPIVHQLCIYLGGGFYKRHIDQWERGCLVHHYHREVVP